MDRTDLLALIILLLGVFPVHSKVDPETNRFNVLLFGEGWSFTPNILMTDPKIIAVNIPAGDATHAAYMDRFMRIYMPRNYQDWVSRVDVFILSDLVPWGFENHHFVWMRQSIEEEGTGMMLSEMGWYGIADWTGNACEDWTHTVLYDAYPCDMVLGEQNLPCAYLDIVTHGPFIDLPMLEQIAFADKQGIHLPRPGTIAWAVYRKGREAAILSRRYGEGMALANSMGIERFIQPYYEWKYYKDYFINHVYLAGGVEIPEDLELVHRVREQLETFRDQRAFVIGMIDFIDRFGANTRPVELMLAEATPMRKMAEGLYIDQRYDEASEVLRDASSMFDRINAKATELRDQALLWVYVIEWSAVSATSLVTGVVIWALMVRRKLYREVAVTRGTPREADRQ